MSLATLKRADEFEATVDDRNSASPLSHGKMNIQMRRALAQMIARCDEYNLAAYCLARGIVVIDTMSDISSQLQEYFPAIDLAPIVDDVSFFVAEQAKANNERYQEIMLKYIPDGKTPDVDEANKNVAFKVYMP